MTKVYNSVKMLVELRFLISTHSLMMLYICIRFCGFGSYRADMISISKFSKGHNSVKTVEGVMVLVICKRLMILYICTKFHKNISKGF